MTRERTLSVNIPPGVEDGTRIRLAGEGEAGARGGPPGDLYIFLSLASHAFFQRDGADPHRRVPVSMVARRRSVASSKFRPSTAATAASPRFPQAPSTARACALLAKGMPVLRSRQTGDMYVQVMVETPQKLTKRQRELLNEFEKLSSQETHPESAGFFGKVQGASGRTGELGLTGNT